MASEAPLSPVEAIRGEIRTNGQMKASTEEIVQAYRETGSVWAAGKRLGMAGQSVHERLVSIGYPMRGRRWDQRELDELRSLMENGLPLGEIARRLGRPFGSTATKASELGLRVQRKQVVKLPRGAGYDKASTGRHMKALEVYEGSVTQYARANGLHVDPLVKACQRHFEERWTAYVAKRSEIPERECPYCNQVYIPNSGRQEYCTRKCANDARRDRSYFGGRRREAVGMTAGVCQLCGREPSKGLSAHHVFGKENDPENDALIALCQGCHKLVGLCGSRKFVGNPAAWEALISLAWFRHHGGDLPPGADTLEVSVEIEAYRDEDEAAA